MHVEEVDSPDLIRFLNSLAAASARLGPVPSEIHNGLSDLLTRRYSTNPSNPEVNEDIQYLQYYLKMADCNSNRFFQYLYLIWEENGLLGMYTRILLKKSLSNCMISLAKAGLQLIQNAKLVFNATLHPSAAEGDLEPELASGILCSLANKTYHTIDRLLIVQNSISFITTTRKKGYQQIHQLIDQDIAEQLNLRCDYLASCDFLLEQEAFFSIASLLNVLITSFDATIRVFSNQLEGAKRDQPDGDKGQAYRELTRVIENTLDATNTVKYNGQVLLGYFVSLHRMETALLTRSRLVNQCISELTSREQKKSSHKPTRHHLTLELIRRGLSIDKSTQTLANVEAYCKTHNASLEEIVPSELSKIFPSLSEIVRDSINQQHQELNVPTEERSQKKQLILSSLDKLSEEFLRVFQQGAMPFFIAALPLFLILGCGLKTPVKNELETFRPSLPHKGKEIVKRNTINAKK